MSFRRIWVWLTMAWRCPDCERVADREPFICRQCITENLDALDEMWAKGDVFDDTLRLIEMVHDMQRQEDERRKTSERIYREHVEQRDEFFRKHPELRTSPTGV
jgi:hypothetical protein